MNGESGKSEGRNLVRLEAVGVNPLAKRLNIAKDDVKHRIFADVAVEVLLAIVESHDSLIRSVINLNVLDSRRLNSVARRRSEKHDCG